MNLSNEELSKVLDIYVSLLEQERFPTVTFNAYSEELMGVAKLLLLSLSGVEGKQRLEVYASKQLGKWQELSLALLELRGGNGGLDDYLSNNQLHSLTHCMNNILDECFRGPYHTAWKDLLLYHKLSQYWPLLMDISINHLPGNSKYKDLMSYCRDFSNPDLLGIKKAFMELCTQEDMYMAYKGGIAKGFFLRLDWEEIKQVVIPCIGMDCIVGPFMQELWKGEGRFEELSNSQVHFLLELGYKERDVFDLLRVALQRQLDIPPLYKDEVDVVINEINIEHIDSLEKAVDVWDGLNPAGRKVVKEKLRLEYKHFMLGELPIGMNWVDVVLDQEDLSKREEILRVMQSIMVDSQA